MTGRCLKPCLLCRAPFPQGKGRRGHTQLKTPLVPPHDPCSSGTSLPGKRQRAGKSRGGARNLRDEHHQWGRLCSPPPTPSLSLPYAGGEGTLPAAGGGQSRQQRLGQPHQPRLPPSQGEILPCGVFLRLRSHPKKAGWPQEHPAPGLAAMGAGELAGSCSRRGPHGDTTRAGGPGKE